MAMRKSQLRWLSIVGSILIVILLLSYVTTHSSANGTIQRYKNHFTAGVAKVFPAKFLASGSQGACEANPRPNLIVSSIDGPVWQDAIYKFMESLEVSLAKDSLRHHRDPTGTCLPPQVHVKIVVPKTLSQDLSLSFQALKRLYPHLDFPGYLPESGQRSVLTRFIGWANLLDDVVATYAKAIVMDLDLTFQRNPFKMRIPAGADLVFYKEWWGMKLGQQRTHVEWHAGCQNSPGHAPGTAYETPAQFRAYAPYEIICDGTTYGTAAAMRVYLRMMAADIQTTDFGCNDQAMHQHIYYTGLLNDALSAAGAGKVVAIPNEQSEVGTIGWVPLVLYNHAGEVLNELGEVQAIVHQYKAHPKIVGMYNNRYAWLADPGVTDVPAIPAFAEDREYTRTKQAEIDAVEMQTASAVQVDVDGSIFAGEVEDERPLLFKQFHMQGVGDGNCTRPEDLCSCWFQGCHMDYAPHVV